MIAFISSTLSLKWPFGHFVRQSILDLTVVIKLRFCEFFVLVWGRLPCELLSDLSGTKGYVALRLRAAFEFGTPGVIHHSTALCTGVQQITRGEGDVLFEHEV
jgi:hypothetical protein